MRALTGTDPDSLPEEKARGMTIDLGFAHASLEGCDINFVDVPGHERFIRNMVAGATGVDLAILVVAADDSVMPQTREHAEVLSLLGVNRYLLVLTKMDLVDDEWGDAVEEEARELLTKLGIEPIACVRTSAETSRGLDELRHRLAEAAKDPQRQQVPYRWFRLPIDRAFVVAGRGTVVTGSVAHGTVRRDDELELWPSGKRIRIRDLQTHHAERDATAGRMRLALNLASIGLGEVGRGQELASPGYLRPTSMLDAWVATLRMPGKTRKQALRLRLHIATNDVLAELTLTNKPEADVCRGVFAQLKVSQPIVATWGQYFILRDESASRTLGGGRILRPVAQRWRSRRPANMEGLQTLLDESPKHRLEEVIRDKEWTVCPPSELAIRAGLQHAEEASRTARSLLDKGRICRLETASQQLLVHASHMTTLANDLDRRLRAHLKANPRLPGVPRTEWSNWMPRACPQRFRGALAEYSLSEGFALLTDQRVVPRGHKDVLSATDKTLLNQVLEELDAGAFQPPAITALRCRTSRNDKRVRELIDLASTRGQLVRVTDDIWLHGEQWKRLVETIVEALRTRGDLTVGDIRTLLSSSRKFVVPIIEKLDALGITRRVGDHRTLGPQAPPTQ